MLPLPNLEKGLQKHSRTLSWHLFTILVFQESHIDLAHANIFQSGQELSFQSTKMDFGSTNYDQKSNGYIFSNDLFSQDLDANKFVGSGSSIQMTNSVQSQVLFLICMKVYKISIERF